MSGGVMKIPLKENSDHTSHSEIVIMTITN